MGSDAVDNAESLALMQSGEEPLEKVFDFLKSQKD